MQLTEAALRLRLKAEMSQRDFAQLLGIGFSAVQKYEAGRFHAPDPRIMMAFLARAIDQSLPDLAATFEHELIATLDPPVGFSIRIIREKGKRQ